jgi:hypothetical protein
MATLVVEWAMGMMQSLMRHTIRSSTSLTQMARQT